MQGEPIRYFDRYKQAYCEEAIFGEGPLRFAYETGLGRLFTRWVGSMPIVSHLMGWYMRQPRTKRRIVPFVQRYAIDTDEWAHPLESYQSFNDFFCRQLKEEARPVDPDLDGIVFPADGRHLGWREIGGEDQVFLKGQRWNLKALLGDPEWIERFRGGSLVLSRLCPVD